jgi:hypothetical protein
MDNMRLIAFGVVGRLVFAAVGIMLAILILRRTGAIHDEEINSNLYRLEVRGLGGYARTSNLNIVSQCFFSGDHRDNYIQSYIRLVRDLKLSGVRAVLIKDPMAQGIIPPDKKSWDFLRELQSSGIVVFGFHYDFRMADSRVVNDLSKGVLTLVERELDETEPLSRIHPAGLPRDFVESPDVTIELLRKYKGYAKNLPVDKSGGEIRFGDFRIPVTQDGWMYSLNRNSSMELVLQYADSSSLKEADRWMFSTQDVKGPGLKWEGGVPWRIHDVGDELRGKIVILRGGLDYYSYNYARAYAVALESIISGNIIKKWEHGHLWLSLALLVVAGLIAYWLRPLVTILLIILLAAATIFIWFYLYEGQNLLIDIFYPLLALAMSAIAFPAITLGSRDRMGEDSVVSM